MPSDNQNILNTITSMIKIKKPEANANELKTLANAVISTFEQINKATMTLTDVTAEIVDLCLKLSKKQTEFKKKNSEFISNLDAMTNHISKCAKKIGSSNLNNNNVEIQKNISEKFNKDINRINFTESVKSGINKTIQKTNQLIKTSFNASTGFINNSFKKASYSVSNFISNTTNKISEIFKTSMHKFKNAFSDVIDVFITPFAMIGKLVGSAFAGLSKIFNSIKNFSLKNILKNPFTSATESIKSTPFFGGQSKEELIALGIGTKPLNLKNVLTKSAVGVSVVWLFENLIKHKAFADTKGKLLDKDSSFNFFGGSNIISKIMPILLKALGITAIAAGVTIAGAVAYNRISAMKQRGDTPEKMLGFKNGEKANLFQKGLAYGSEAVAGNVGKGTVKERGINAVKNLGIGALIGGLIGGGIGLLGGPAGVAGGAILGAKIGGGIGGVTGLFGGSDLAKFLNKGLKGAFAPFYLVYKAASFIGKFFSAKPAEASEAEIVKKSKENLDNYGKHINTVATSSATASMSVIKLADKTNEYGIGMGKLVETSSDFNNNLNKTNKEFFPSLWDSISSWFNTNILGKGNPQRSNGVGRGGSGPVQPTTPLIVGNDGKNITVPKSVFEKTKEVISNNEGSYGSVNMDKQFIDKLGRVKMSNGGQGVGIGKLQWTGPRATSLLKDMEKENPILFRKYMGEEFTKNLLSGNWDKSGRKFTSDNKSAYEKMMKEEQFRKVHDRRFDNDVAGYIAIAKKWGVTDPKAIALVSDTINQYGAGAAKKFIANGTDYNSIRQTILTKGDKSYASGRLAKTEKILANYTPSIEQVGGTPLQNASATAVAGLAKMRENITSLTTGGFKSLGHMVQDAIDRGVKYSQARGDSNWGLFGTKIDCSGLVTVLGQTAIKDLISKTKDPSQIKRLEQYYKAYGAIGNNKTGKFGLSGYQFDALAKLSGGAIFRPTKDQLKEGMVIGQNVSAGGWGQRGIDHIAQVVRHPKTGELVIAESNGKNGVTFRKLDEFIRYANKKGQGKYQGQWYATNGMPSDLVQPDKNVDIVKTSPQKIDLKASQAANDAAKLERERILKEESDKRNREALAFALAKQKNEINKEQNTNTNIESNSSTSITGGGRKEANNIPKLVLEQLFGLKAGGESMKYI